MTSYTKDILNVLIDRFEKSKTFTGNNQIKQSFSVQPQKIFPDYTDGTAFEVFKSVNEAAAELAQAGYIKIKQKNNGVINSVSLNIDCLDEIYHTLQRTPKKDTNTRLEKLLNSYTGCNDILDRYCLDQIQRLAENKNIPQFDGNFDTFRNLLECLSKILTVEKETYQRDFSSAVLHDSKAFEKIKSKAVGILFEYGDFATKETVLEELNIIRNPGHIYLKGSGIIRIGNQALNLCQIDGDIGISSSLLDTIEQIEVTAHKVITIENLTTFNAFCDEDYFVIYLGGYHNHARREFIRKVYTLNPAAEYYHFGDIDAGGFYILMHLRNKTGVHFQPYKMDIPTLQEHFKDTKKLTDNDRIRLKNLLHTEFGETVQFMLEHNCKLEQENLD